MSQLAMLLLRGFSQASLAVTLAGSFFGLCTVVLPNVWGGEPFHWGVNGHPVSQESYWHVPLEKQLDLVKELGLAWYRFDVSSEDFAGNTARLDQLLTAAERPHYAFIERLVREDQVPFDIFAWHWYSEMGNTLVEVVRSTRASGRCSKRNPLLRLLH